MKSLADKSEYILRFDKGEKLIEELIKFLEEKGIKAGSFTGLGSVSSLSLAYFFQSKKEFKERSFNKELEIVSLVGNISTFSGKPYVHAHVVVSDEKFQAYAGHLKEAVIGATAELVLKALDLDIGRAFSDEIQLNLLAFPIQNPSMHSCDLQATNP